MLQNIILIALLVLIVALSGLYVYKAKKSGAKCVGCPAGRECGKNGGCCGCK